MGASTALIFNLLSSLGVQVNAKNGGEWCEPPTEQRACNTFSCAIDCVQSGWTGYDANTHSCKPYGAPMSWYRTEDQKRWRSRSVITPAFNGGKACKKARDWKWSSYSIFCPIHCSVSGWSKNGACTEKCGGGIQKFQKNIQTSTTSGHLNILGGTWKFWKS